MMNKSALWGKIKQNWLFLLIAAQPLLDALAYWTNNSNASWAGYLRLAVMIVLPVCTLIKTEKKKRFLGIMSVIGVLCALHILNCFRVGYIDPARDIKYTAMVAQTPVLTVCFLYALRDNAGRDRAVGALELAAALTVLILLLSIITGTDNCTYGIGLGISGWVIDTNRCANSIILVSLFTFAMLRCARTENKILHVVIPAAVMTVFLTNGTKACYLGLFALFIGYAVFLVLYGKIQKKRINSFLVAVLLVLTVVAAAVYPLTPRYKVEQLEAGAVALKDQDELIRLLKEKGYDPERMTIDEKLENPEVREIFENYYRKLMWHVIPEMFDRFDMERILRKYNMTTSAATLIDVRQMKRTYASLIWEDKDFLTKLVGYEVSEIHDKGLDPENDYPAIFWYFGYLGFGAYMLFLLYFIVRIAKKLLRDFKGSVTLLNFSLILCLGLQLGLAQFSGALLRRPNVSIYLAVVLALIYYQTNLDAEIDKGLEQI